MPTVVAVLQWGWGLELLGRAAWWLPRWLDRLLPRAAAPVAVPAQRAGTADRSDPAPTVPA